jgi:hypothetical protein
MEAEPSHRRPRRRHDGGGRLPTCRCQPPDRVRTSTRCRCLLRNGPTSGLGCVSRPRDGAATLFRCVTPLSNSHATGVSCAWQPLHGRVLLSACVGPPRPHAERICTCPCSRLCCITRPRDGITCCVGCVVRLSIGRVPSINELPQRLGNPVQSADNLASSLGNPAQSRHDVAPSLDGRCRCVARGRCG